MLALRMSEAPVFWRFENMKATEAGGQSGTKRWKLVVIVVVLIALAGGFWGWKEGRPWYYGIQTYLYGFPLVMMDLTKDQGTAVPTAGEITAPINQFAVMTKYPDASFRAVVRTGLDTLFADSLGRPRQGAARAVRAGHQRALLRHRAVRHVEQRLHIDRQAQHRHRRGELSDRRAPLAGHAAGQCQAGLPLADAFVWVNGQMQANGPQDYEEVNALQKQYKLTPLSAWGRPYTPTRRGAGRRGRRHEDTARRAGEKDGRRRFFRTACTTDEGQSPAPADGPMVEKMKALGIEPGKDFDIDKIDQ